MAVDTVLAPHRTAVCTCLDLPRAHSRGDVGCQHETPTDRPTRPTAAQLERNRLRAAQRAGFLAAAGTDDLR